MRRVYGVVFIIILFLSCARTDEVIEVIDGDTFKTESGKTVRLLGINAAETAEAGADIAKEFLTRMVLHKTVRLEMDISEHDDYDRLLRYVFVNGMCVNAELIRMGYVETRFYPPDTARKYEFEELERQAIRNKRGLWAFAVFQIPDTTGVRKIYPETKSTSEVISWRDADKYYGQTKTVEGTIVVANNTGKVCFLNFHKDWKKYFTAVIFASDFDKFPSHPEDYYLNRTVRVQGLIKEYKGKPEIIIKSPSQIEIVE